MYIPSLKLIFFKKEHIFLTNITHNFPLINLWRGATRIFTEYFIMSGTQVNIIFGKFITDYTQNNVFSLFFYKICLFLGNLSENCYYLNINNKYLIHC